MVEWGLFFSLERLTGVLHFMSVLFGADRSWLPTAAGLIIAATGSFLLPMVAGLFLSTSILGMLTFYYLKLPFGPLWHLGPIFLAWTAAIWLSRTCEPHKNVGSRICNFVFGATLLTQSWYGVSAVRADLERPLSNGSVVARYIQSQGWQNDPLAGSMDYAMAPIIGYLGIDRAYFVEGSRWGSFTMWDQTRLAKVDWDDALAKVRRLGSRVTLVLSDTRVDAALLMKNGFSKVAARFEGSRRIDEDYVLYRSGE
jgi:hypothetical protein